MLTNTQACTDVEQIALKHANLGHSAKIESLRRKTFNSHDLVILVTNESGHKEVTITKRMLDRHQAAAKKNLAA